MPLPHPRRLALLSTLLLAATTVGAAPATASTLPWHHRDSPTRAAASTAPSAGSGAVHLVAPAGDDAGPGTLARPWRTLARAARAGLGPGDTLLVRRGATYQGGLVLTTSGTAVAPIRVVPTGTGTNPVVEHGDCVRLKGDHIQVSGLTVRDCSWSGVSLEGAHDSLTSSAVSGNVVGVHVTETATDGLVSGNRIYDNRRLSPGKDGPNDDSGVNGVAVQGVRTVISYNRFSGHHAPSPDYGTEGSAIEVYGARATRILANSSVDNSSFVELGDRRTDDTLVSRNTVTSTIAHGYFLVTRGSWDSTFGPVRNTRVMHNSVAMNGDRDGGLICYGGCSPSILTASGNVVVSRDNPVWTDDKGMGGGNNIFVNDSDPRTARRLFVDRRRDLRLVRDSPAVDSGGVCASTRISPRAEATLGPSSMWCRDGNADGRRAMDLGALER